MVQLVSSMHGRFVVRENGARSVMALSSKYQQWNGTYPPLNPQTRKGSYWSQIEAIRNNGTRPVARWRRAVATVVEPLLTVSIFLLLWGMIGQVQLALIVAVALALAVVLLVGTTLIVSACASKLGYWRRRDSC
jgi:hypothetical protein